MDMLVSAGRELILILAAVQRCVFNSNNNKKLLNCCYLNPCFTFTTPPRWGEELLIGVKPPQ